MSQALKILGISGSLRKGSYNTALLHAAAGAAGSEAEVQIIEIGSFPLYNGDMESDMPQQVRELKAAVKAADGILLVTPEYNYSFSGVLKNAIDWVSRPYGDNSFDGKPVGVMSASSGMLGGSRAQYQLRQTFVFLNMRAMNHPEVMVPLAGKKFSEQGALTDEETRKKVEAFMKEFASFVRRSAS